MVLSLVVRPIPTFKSVPSEPDPSFVQCPHCSRRFNEQAAERHIPKCKSIIAKVCIQLELGPASWRG